MPTPLPSDANPPEFLSSPSRWAHFGGLLLLLLITACSSPIAPNTGTTPAKTAHLVMINPGDHEWQITISSSGSYPSSTSHVAVHGTLKIELPGGEYTFEQRMLNAGPGPEHVRHFAAHFENGQNYEWQLATLEPVVLQPEGSSRP